MKKVSISKIVEKPVSGEWGNEAESETDGTPVIRNTNFSDDGRIDLHDVAFREIPDRKIEKKRLKPGDIIIEKSGGSKNQPVGRVVYFDIDDDKNYLFSNFTSAIRPKKDVEPKYVHYGLLHSYMRGGSELFQNKTTGIRNLQLKRYLDKVKIPLPSLSEQKAIVAKLDRAQRLIDIDKEMLSKYDNLIQSVFLEMFGDPITNSKGWKVGSITDYGSLKNGLNYSSNESGTKIRSLGVGDFGVLSKIDDIRAISRIELDEAPPENYLLKDNDLVFVRSNGNKELVGRCLVIYPGNEDVTFSGFCIRYRPKSSSINSTYLSHLFRVKSFRNYMLKDGRGANIQNINQKLLSQLDIPLPDISKQNQFAKNVEKLEGQILKTQTSRKKSEELFSSLVQGAFG
ncbi:MAG TPA: restriction endonuclease subunit S [Balneolaceae bacterium]|mgnify:CR=1 FL=1|nr:restriction endonuclease subunit S [Balneolaceae bacterium]